MNRVRPCGRAKPECDTDGRERHRLPHEHPPEFRLLRAERDPDPDFPCPLRNRIRDDAVDADRAKNDVMPPAIASMTTVNDVRASDRSTRS